MRDARLDGRREPWLATSRYNLNTSVQSGRMQLSRPRRPRSRIRAKTSSGVPSPSIGRRIPRSAVVVQQRLGQPSILPKSLADGLAVVVRPAACQQPLDQLLPPARRVPAPGRAACRARPACRSSASACGTVRGKPSNRQPRAQSLFAKPIGDDADDDIVRHELAGLHVSGPLRGRASCRPPAARAAFRRSRDGQMPR